MKKINSNKDWPIAKHWLLFGICFLAATLCFAADKIKCHARCDADSYPYFDQGCGNSTANPCFPEIHTNGQVLCLREQLNPGWKIGRAGDALGQSRGCQFSPYATASQGCTNPVLATAQITTSQYGNCVGATTAACHCEIPPGTPEFEDGFLGIITGMVVCHEISMSPDCVH
jgi:hypothetical protein